MKNVLFLITPGGHQDDNAARLPELFEQHGWQVSICKHEELTWQRDRVYCADRPADDYVLIWPIGLGPQRSFLDRVNLLEQINPPRLLSNPRTYVSQHGKLAWHNYMPVSFVAASAEPLISAFEQLGGQWILKPIAGSFGRAVQRIYSAQSIRETLGGDSSGYWMLQRYIEEITAGETRTLICANQIIGSYLRTPSASFHANLAAHAVPSQTQLDPTERALVETVKQDLAIAGIGFAAIDTVGGYLMEVNIANPGGLGTLQTLYGKKVGERFMQAVNSQWPC